MTKNKKKIKYEFDDVDFIPLKQTAKEKEKSEREFGAFMLNRWLNRTKEEKINTDLLQLKYSTAI